MNKEQANAATKAMCDWLSDPHELGKMPTKIEIAEEFDLHGMHYYIFKFKKSFFGKWLLGVCGGYEDNGTEHCGHVFSEMKEYDEKTAAVSAIEMVEMIRAYWMEQARKFSEQNRFNEENQQKALEVLKNILHALHEKRFGDVITYVGESEIEDLETYLAEYVQETIEMNDFFTIDEYGAPCLFNPAYEYSQLDMDEYNDKSGFYLEYAMTSDGDLVDITLKLKFIYAQSGLKSVFCGVDFG